MAKHTITCNPDGSFSPAGVRVKERDTVRFKSASGCRVSITPASPAFFSPAPPSNPFPVPAGKTGVSYTVAGSVSAAQDFSIMQIGAPMEGGSGTIRVNT